jgi:type IV pilus assembly protein PilX
MSPRQAQTGLVLVVGLIVLLVMTLLGLAAARSTLLEERMAGGNADNTLAFQAAEAALRAGELSLQAPIVPDFDGGGRYPALEFTNPELPPRWRQWEGTDENANWSRDAIAYTGLRDAPAPLNRAGARYYIEEFPRVYAPGESLAADVPVDEMGLYRITARGTGISGLASVILQSTYKR